MNGTSRLYRSTSEHILGGVAAGIGNYLRIDANLVRLLILLLTLFTGGGFAAVYFLLWLLLPTATSTATDLSGIVNENISDMGNQFRNLTGIKINGGNIANGGTGGNVQPGAAPTANGGQLPQGQAPAQYPARAGNAPIVLILIGAFFLLANLGLFHWIRWGFWWPVVLIGLGVLMLRRRA